MKNYLVKLTPQEPYFFGNEKTFKFSGEENQGQLRNSYFIRSERTPLQSTLMGALRYILMPYKDFAHYAENSEVIGSESFKIYAENQSFGVIKEISPLFIMKGDDKYVVTPFDGRKKHNAQNAEYYMPFSEYSDDVLTDKGKKIYTTEFNAKDGIIDSYVNISDKSIICADKLFSTEIRVGVKKTVSSADDDGAFFKKEYCRLNNDYCFAFYALLDEGAKLPKKMRTEVFMGQGKSQFIAEFIEEENTLEDDVSKILSKDISYCLSDSLVKSDVYDYCKFAAVRFRDYRAYETMCDGKVKKGSTLYKLIKAGSVFIPSDNDKFREKIENSNCKKIGFNYVISNKEE